MIDQTPQLSALHQVYCLMTGRELAMTTKHMWAWEIFLARGFTAVDMRMVIIHIQKLIKADRRRPESFRFHNLVENLDRFAEDLAESKALYRRPAMDPGKASVLRSIGKPTAQNEATVRSAAQILAADQALAEFRRLKDTL